jgi:dCMP deaminase
VEKSAEGVKINGYVSNQVNGNHGRPPFPNVDALLEFVTTRWREHFVTTDVWDEATLDALIKRPFFLLISVDAPVSIRWKRFKERYELQDASFFKGVNL